MLATSGLFAGDILQAIGTLAVTEPSLDARAGSRWSGGAANRRGRRVDVAG